MPDDFRLEIVLAENLIEHGLAVMAGVPIAVIVKAASLLQNPRQLGATGPHELDIRPRRFVAILKGSLLFGFPPENFVGPVGIERRVDINKVDARIGQLFQLLQVVAAIDDASIENGRGLNHR